MSLAIGAITIDCHDKHALAAFWCAALGTAVRGEFGQYLGLHPVSPGHPRLVFQQVASPRRPSGTHLDLHVQDAAAVERETERLLGLGATLVDDVEDFGVRWRVLADPEGNLFCIVPDA